MCVEAPGLPHEYAVLVLTSEARSSPDIDGHAASAALAVSVGRIAGTITPRRTPTVLKCRVRRRVSTSYRIGISAFAM